MRRWRWCFRRFWASKTQIFVHLGRETPQKRLRNGWRNGRVSAKVTASASPRCDQRSWGVALPSDQASRRSSPARARVPPGPFSPTLYLKTPFPLLMDYSWLLLRCMDAYQWLSHRSPLISCHSTASAQHTAYSSTAHPLSQPLYIFLIQL